MPRPHVRPDAALWLAAALGCAALGPAALHAALAAAAGTLFEAAPFVLAAELLPQRLGLLTAVAGCGCGRRAPGALSLPATAVCWVAFGPFVALARFAAGVLIFAVRRRPGRGVADGTVASRDAFDELLALGPCAALAVVLAGGLGAAAHHLGATFVVRAGFFVAGCLLGTAAPCATAAVAIAAALAPAAPAAAAGVLACGGLVSIAAFSKGPYFARPAPVESGSRRGAWSRIGLALALGILCVRGASGFVNPRLLPFAGAGAVFALLGARRPARSGNAAYVPAILFVALATGSPVPPEAASATRLDEAYPGERLAFVGRAHRSDRATVLERAIITCCRADASAVALRLSTQLRIADGTWIAATGTVTRSDDGFVLRTARWHVVAAPADPFLYR